MCDQSSTAGSVTIRSRLNRNWRLVDPESTELVTASAVAAGAILGKLTVANNTNIAARTALDLITILNFPLRPCQNRAMLLP
jgi:hypothetical protein